MRNIHIIHASRQRPIQASNTYHTWHREMKDGDTYTIAIEQDQSDNYKGLPCVVVTSHTAIEAFNLCAENIKDRFKPYDIIIGLSDDFPEPCNLDLIREACDSDKLLKTFDGIQKWIVTLPIMGAEFYKKHGYIYPQQYKHMFADTHLTHESEINNVLQIRNDITIKHHHYSIGGAKKDTLNDKNDKTFNEGKEVYLTWAKKQTKQLTSIESAGMRNWLRNK